MVEPSSGSFFDIAISLRNDSGATIEEVHLPNNLMLLESDIVEALLAGNPGTILERSFFTDDRYWISDYPGRFSEFLSVRLGRSSLTPYTLYDAERPIPLVAAGFQDADGYVPSRTMLVHTFKVYEGDGSEWTSPTVRLHIGLSYPEAITAFRVDNGIGDVVVVPTPVEVVGGFATFEWTRQLEDGAKIIRYVVTASPLYLTAPQLTEPLDRAAVSASVSLNWSAVEGATVHGIQVETDEALSQSLFVDDAISGGQFGPVDLESGTTYFWRVRAVSESATSSWSSVRRFRTEGDDIADRLIAHYPFDGGAQDAVGGLDGTMMGDVALVADRLGHDGSAYSFDGSDDYIVLPDSGAIAAIDHGLTFSAWVYPESYGTGQTAVLVHDQHWYVRLEGGGLVNAYVFSLTEGAPDVTSQDLASTGSWSHIAFTYDGNHLRAYVNGEFSGETEYASAAIGSGQSSSAPTLGVGNGDNWDDFHGAMDDVRIYDRALSAAEISALHQGTEGGVPSPDLNGDGSVGFNDFFIFADAFGTTVSK